MEFRILGPLEVVEHNRVLSLGDGRHRALLALLLLHPNELLSADRLIDELWGSSPPPTAPKMVQGYVSKLRKELGERRGENERALAELQLRVEEVSTQRAQRH